MINALTGTGTLIRLALRRDRITLPVWIVIITGLVAADLPAALELYANSPTKQLEYAATNALSIAGRVTGGPINGSSLGSIAMNEIFLFAAIAAAFMSTLAVVRHTRQNEETGRAELLSSTIVGRHASLTAALLVAMGANVVLATLTALAFMANDLPTTGSIAAGTAIGAVGIVFAAIAAITVQLSENARGASGLAGVSIGVAFLLRAIGDGLGEITQGGLAIKSAWPSWLSPIGWGQQIHPFTEGNWWVFSLFAIAFLILASTAFILISERDLGMGMIPTRPGPAAADEALLSPFGLAWRLQFGILRGWAIGIVVLGATIGLMGKEFYDIYSNDQFAAVLQRIVGNGNISDLFFGFMMNLLAIVVAGYALQSLLRIRDEEADGRLEPVLATATGRLQWMMSHIFCTLIGIVTLSLLLGFSTGVAYVLTADANWSQVFVLTKAALVQAPAVLALAGFVILALGLLPRWSVAVAWTGFVLCLILGQFGAILKLPEWVLNISPFTHTPAAPAEAIAAAPIIILLAVFLGLMATGMAFFRRRDLVTG